MRWLLGARLRGGNTTGVRLIQPGALAGGGLLTFSRAQVASVATAPDASTLRLYAADVPRFRGAARRLLLEGQGTNIVPNPRTIAGTGWANNGVSSTATTGPDGDAASGRKLNEGTTTSNHRTEFLASPPSVTAGQRYPNVFFARADTASTIQIYRGGTQFGTTNFANFDLSGGGAIGSAGSDITEHRIEAVGGGWLECSCTMLALASGTPSQIISMCMTTSPTAARLESYTGTNRTVDVAFMQGEENAAFASSVILPDTTGAATRGADLPSAAFATLFPNGVGTILASYMLPRSLSFAAVLFEAHDGTVNNRIHIRQDAGGTGIICRYTIGGANVDLTSLGSMTPGTVFRLGLTFDGTTITANLNGGTNRSATAFPPGLTTLRIGNNAANTAPLYGEIGYFDVLPYVIPAGDLPAAVAAFP
jgi:hypothetical protein